MLVLLLQNVEATACSTALLFSNAEYAMLVLLLLDIEFTARFTIAKR